jgi:tRNA (guanine-N7-)-methyltransferase
MPHLGGATPAVARATLCTFAPPATLPSVRRAPTHVRSPRMTHRPSHEARGVPVEQPRVASVAAASAARRNADLRVRQHVNPLAAYFQRPVTLDDGWLVDAFEHPERPLVVDVGVARGRWAKAMAGREREGGAGVLRSGAACNYLGLEIRAGLVAAANGVRDRDGLRNLHYLYCNANVSFADIIGAADGRVALVCFQFCDPWFKARHAKRRLVQAPLVAAVAGALAASRGRCYVASDVRALAEEMRDRFDECGALVRDDALEWDGDGWLVDNPFGMPTEREVTVLNRPGAAVYRAMFKVK